MNFGRVRMPREVARSRRGSGLLPRSGTRPAPGLTLLVLCLMLRPLQDPAEGTRSLVQLQPMYTLPSPGRPGSPRPTATQAQACGPWGTPSSFCPTRPGPRSVCPQWREERLTPGCRSTLPSLSPSRNVHLLPASFPIAPPAMEQE